MKQRLYLILCVALIAIVANQTLWIINMYDSYRKEIRLEMNTSLEKAVYMEVTERSEDKGGFGAFPLYSENGDTTRYIRKEIFGEDTTFTATIDRHDPNANLKIVQYFLKNMTPINIARINEIFCYEMQWGKFPVQNTYIDFYDLQADTLIASTLSISFASVLSSDRMVIDIMDSMGIQASIENPILTILGRMIFQLILSIVLILIAITGLFVLGRTVYMQWRQEKMRQDAISSMTHEFKRPISTAVSLISLIPYYLQKGNAERASVYAENTLQELNKLTAYTERIQQISNNNQSTLCLNYTDIEIRPFFEAIREKYHSTADTSGADSNRQVQIRLHIRSLQSHIRADLLHFSNVLDNLVENAIKYSADQVTIDLSIMDTDNGVQISVKDNGFGISTLDQKYIFDKYYRSVNRSVWQKTGFGLGLTYAKSVIEAHNGKIGVSSKVGEGSEFRIYMPL